MASESRSVVISLDEAIRLRNALVHKGFQLTETQGNSELFSVRDQDVDLAVYKTGKVVYRPAPQTERILRDALNLEFGYDYFMGSDETGKGEWFGPLVVVATAAAPEVFDKVRLMGAKDSKVLTRKAVFDLASQLDSMRGLLWRSVVLMPERYNELYSEFRSEHKSLNDLLAWAHSAALRELLDKLGSKRVKIVIDQFDPIKMDLRLSAIDRDRVTVVQRPRGEDDPMVAAASILAKWVFEREVDDLSARFLTDLRKAQPRDVPRDRLRSVAKLHFQNVTAAMEARA